MSKSLDSDSPILPCSMENRLEMPKLALSELSEKDKVWDKHRHSADLVAHLYRGEADFDKYAQRIDSCSKFLDFRLVPNADLGQLELRLSATHFCRTPRCPMCQWRRSLKWKGRALKCLPLVVNDYPNYRWLFLTLTQKNCPVTELRETVTEMNKSFVRLTKLKQWSAVGWIKSLEVTRGWDNSAHPHFHCLLMVPLSYFSRDYIDHEGWINLWRRAARLDYEPVVYIRAVNKEQDPIILIPEILKYSLKESDLYKSKEFLLEVTRQLYKMRSVSVGGLLRGYMKKIEEEPEDLIHGDEIKTESEVDEGHLYFEWKYQEKKYRLK